MNIKKLNEELKNQLQDATTSNIMTAEIQQLDAVLDWAYGKIRALDNQYQHSRISNNELIEEAIKMANRILDAANNARSFNNEH